MQSGHESGHSFVSDRGEPIGLIYPLLIGSSNRNRSALSDLAMELVRKSAALSHSLPKPIIQSLSDLMRAMNCYYSNLIEGHNTHPVDIERALRNDLSADPRKRDLQREAAAHIAVQQWIDGGGLSGSQALMVEGIREIHRRFALRLPDEMLIVEDRATSERVPVMPGELRQRDVQVGAHVAVSPGAVPRFLERFEQVYAKLGPSESVLAMAAAHHRLLWIHPFLDGNGRVARLMSHAVALELLDTGGVWSVARGLARNVSTYKGLLANCDLPRRNDLDGCGSLSEEALVEFTRFFLKISVDQVEFMESLVQPERLRLRILLWAEEEIRLDRLPHQAGAILDAILRRGELARGDVSEVIGTGDRQARRVVSGLLASGAITSGGPRATLRLSFPATLAARWLPGLFPEQPQ